MKDMDDVQKSERTLQAEAMTLALSLSSPDEPIHLIPDAFDIRRAFDLTGTLVFVKSGSSLQALQELLEKKTEEYAFEVTISEPHSLSEPQSKPQPAPDRDTPAFVIIRNIQKKDDDGYRFIQNRKCRYFPCHKNIDPENFNCLFCYCPLYAKGTECGGNFTILESGIKSCLNCTIPHQKQNYDYINKKLMEKN